MLNRKVLSSNVSDLFRRGRRWAAQRPFTGGVVMLLSAAALAIPSLTTLHVGDVLVTISTVAGVSTTLLAALMAVCGCSVLARASARLPAGIAALVLALVALPASNFGGFLIGTALGIVGSALTLAWSAHPAGQQRGAVTQPR